MTNDTMTKRALQPIPNLILLASLLWILPFAQAAPDFKPDEPIDGTEIVFDKKAWEKHGLPVRLTPWPGKQVVFLTTTNPLEPAVVQRFVERLDQGWELYSDLTGRKPSLFKQLRGKPAITAVPTPEFTCGAGCGFVGASGVELALFYQHDYPALQKHPQRFPHYAFYELGRNFYTFGHRHSCFTTGFAVFMRYVCMDTLQCEDAEADLRRHIERMEEVYAGSGESFLRTFTMLGGLGEKAPRLKGADGKSLDPCDQPVMYASAMLKLRRDYGGNEWLKKFYRALADCPAVKPADKASAQRQCLSWVVSASLAANRDLSGVFCDRWHMPLTKEQRAILSATDYHDASLKAADLAQRLHDAASPW